ncbi:hypothetical protein TNCT_333731 [Trichonephila clavata]|uniref:Uncharacterized protein n=1 Tax=Trichonephila clavata TaxID=2740835 RepID=A0A8X6FWF5_TRICU|nr:hypothetical protein TNCT_333731 [Trichonephila clavata]
MMSFISRLAFASCENSSPGEDLISYRHWREIDPSCTILTRMFNICLQVADIPASGKPPEPFSSIKKMSWRSWTTGGRSPCRIRFISYSPSAWRANYPTGAR